MQLDQPGEWKKDCVRRKYQVLHMRQIIIRDFALLRGKWKSTFKSRKITRIGLEKTMDALRSIRLTGATKWIREQHMARYRKWAI